MTGASALAAGACPHAEMPEGLSPPGAQSVPTGWTIGVYLDKGCLEDLHSPGQPALTDRGGGRPGSGDIKLKIESLRVSDQGNDNRKIVLSWSGYRLVSSSASTARTCLSLMIFAYLPSAKIFWLLSD